MKRTYALIFSMLGVLTLSSCVRVITTVANAPSAFFDGEVKRDISFGEEPWQKLDIYKPALESETLPVIVFFYGGRWSEGSKEQYRFAATKLATEGFIVVIPDYRKYPEVKFPAFVEDGADAVNWVHENISSHGGQPENLFLSGHSAGAHIAGLIVSDKHYLDSRGSARDAIKGFAGLAGPYDFTPEEEDLKEMFGPPSEYSQMQVTTFIDGSEPPMLLMRGEEDTTVATFNSERLATKISESGGAVETVSYPELDHLEMVGALSWWWRSKAPLAEDMAKFFSSQLNPETDPAS